MLIAVAYLPILLRGCYYDRMRVPAKKDTFTTALIVLFVLVLGFSAYKLVSHVVSSRATAHSVLGWGYNDVGQLGRGNITIGSITTSAKPAQLGDVTQLSAGLRHSLALYPDGSVLSWGTNKYAELGDGKRGGRKVTPSPIAGLPKIKMIATKQDHNLALDEDGNVWAWGLNMSGQIGNGTNRDRATPQKVAGLPKIASVATGYRSSVAVGEDGSVWVWGGNCNLANRSKTIQDYVNELTVDGYADTSGGTIETVTPADDCQQEKYLNIKSSVPKKIEGLPAVKTVSAGYGHMLALTTEGDVWAWGCNLYGQVGNGIPNNSAANLKPEKITQLKNVREVSAGFRHSLALDKDGKVWAWGHNYNGELGNGKTEDESITASPQQISNLQPIKHIYAGHDYSLATASNGHLLGWGQASFGQLGPAEDSRPRPVAIYNLTNVKAVAAGGGHVLATAEQ